MFHRARVNFLLFKITECWSKAKRGGKTRFAKKENNLFGSLTWMLRKKQLVKIVLVTSQFLPNQNHVNRCRCFGVLEFWRPVFESSKPKIPIVPNGNRPVCCWAMSLHCTIWWVIAFVSRCIQLAYILMVALVRKSVNNKYNGTINCEANTCLRPLTGNPDGQSASFVAAKRQIYKLLWERAFYFDAKLLLIQENRMSCVRGLGPFQSHSNFEKEAVHMTRSLVLRIPYV